MQTTTTTPRPTAAPIFLDLRQRVLELDPTEIGLAPTANGVRVWAVLMEMGMADATVTLVSVGDGATSLYFSNGGGIVGGGETAAVAEATLRFLATAEEFLPQLTPADEFPLPDPGRVTFTVLTHDGAFRADVAEAELQSGDHALTPLYAMGQEVITQVRLREESQ